MSTAQGTALVPVQRAGSPATLYGVRALERGAAQPPIVLTPDTVDITLVRGADVTIFVDVEGADDLESWVLVGEIRLGEELVGAWNVVEQTAESITLQLPHATTATLPLTCSWDLWRCDFPRGPIVQGTIKVEPRVTVCPPE